MSDGSAANYYNIWSIRFAPTYDMMPNNLTFSPDLDVIKCFNIIFVLLLQKLSNHNKGFIRYSILNGFWGGGTSINSWSKVL